MSSKAFTSQIFRFLYQVNANRNLLAVDLKVALALTLYFNENDDGGRAFPSYKTLADQAGVSEHTVIRSVRRLEQGGHLRVVWGRRGAGHPNAYWITIKPAPVQVSEAEKPASVKIKPAPVQENHLKNQEREAKASLSIGERKNRLRDLPADSGRAPDGAARSDQEARSSSLADDKTAAAFRDLREVWRRGWPADETPKAIAAGWRAFGKAIAEGADAAQILEVAKQHVAATDERRYLPRLDAWLDARGFAQPPPQKPQHRRRGPPRSAAQAMASLAKQLIEH